MRRLQDKKSEFENLFNGFKENVSSDIEKLEGFTEMLSASIKEAVTPSLATVVVAAEKVNRTIQEAAQQEHSHRQALHQLMKESQETVAASHQQLREISIIANELNGLKKNLTWLVALVTSAAFIVGMAGGFLVSKFW